MEHNLVSKIQLHQKILASKDKVLIQKLYLLNPLCYLSLNLRIRYSHFQCLLRYIPDTINDIFSKGIPHYRNIQVYTDIFLM
jgi:hypothetical protein